MSEFYADDESFEETINLDVKNSRFIHWINKCEKNYSSSIISELVAKWEESNIQVITIIENSENISIIGISLDSIWEAMNDFKNKTNTTPDKLVLTNKSTPCTNITDSLFDTSVIKHIPNSFPISWTANKTPYSIILPPLNNNFQYRCYKLYKSVQILSAGNIIRSGEEYELV